MKSTMKKTLGLVLALVLACFCFTGCQSQDSAIVVVTREEGSGTRGAFTELFGIEEITLDADVTNATSVMMQTVAGNVNAIGYMSLGSLNDSVKAVEVDGVAATTDNVRSGSYKVARDFNLATKDGLSAQAQAFLDFCMSAEGQAVIEENGYIASAPDAAAYASGAPAGKVVVAGSSSVTPVMEKLAEAYAALNPDADVQVQQSDSSTGVRMAAEGSCDIGMASRGLKDEELSQGLTSTTLAVDGLAVIVNNDSAITSLSSEQITAIFTGATTKWSELK